MNRITGFVLDSNVRADDWNLYTHAETHVFSYDEIRRRFDACVGRTFGENDSSDMFGRYAGMNKGIAGDVVEQSVLGYPADSKQEPDLEIDDLDVELKVTVLKLNTRGDVVATTTLPGRIV